MNVQVVLQHVLNVMKMPTDINQEPNVFVKPDIMIMEVITNAKYVVIIVTNVLDPPITVPYVLHPEIHQLPAHAQKECMMMDTENVSIVHTNVYYVLEPQPIVILVMETEKDQNVPAQPIITMMVLMPIAHNVQTDVPLVLVVMFVLLVKLTEFSIPEFVNVKMELMKSVVPKELLVMLLAHNQNVLIVIILV